MRAALALALSLCACAHRAPAWRSGPGLGLPAETLDGRPYPLSGPGAVRLVDVWASWCAPCAEAAPRVRRVLARHPGVVGLSLSVDDDPAALRRHLERHGVPGLPLRCPGGFPAAARRGLDAIPLFVVLDGRGRLAGEVRGLTPRLEAELDRLVRLALHGPGEPR